MNTTFGNNLEQPCVDCGGHPLRAVHDRNGAAFTHYYVPPAEHEQPAPEGEERVTVELIDGEAGRCIGINDYRVCGPRPIHGVVVTSWKTTKNDVLRAFLTPDEKHDWLAKELTVVPAEHARLAALAPGLVEALQLCLMDTEQAALTGNPIANERRKIAEHVLNAVAKEREK